MEIKNWENDVKELTALGKELFEKTNVLVAKITKELQKDATEKLNEFKDNFDKTMKILFKAEEKTPVTPTTA